MPPLRVLFLGFGNVGRALLDILAHRDRYPGLAARDVRVVGIVTGGHGAVARPHGLDPAPTLAHWAREGHFAVDHPDHAALSALDAVRGLDYDAVAEMTPLAWRARGEPAVGHVRAALERGRHVVTANKGPIAFAYGELSALAAQRGVRLLHEATVMDGVPVFNLARHGLRGATVARVEGILNSTTNVVLAVLEEGGSVAEAVARAQREGFAEADPADDLDGWDAAVKVAVLANVLMGGALDPADVERESLRGLVPARPAAVRAGGRRLKVVCEAWREGGGLRGRVALREVEAHDPFARVEGASSILRIVSDLAGSVVITEEHPDIRVTAYGVLSDLLSLADG